MAISCTPAGQPALDDACELNNGGSCERKPALSSPCGRNVDLGTGMRHAWLAPRQSREAAGPVSGTVRFSVMSRRRPHLKQAGPGSIVTVRFGGLC